VEVQFGEIEDRCHVSLWIFGDVGEVSASCSQSLAPFGGSWPSRSIVDTATTFRAIAGRRIGRFSTCAARTQHPEFARDEAFGISRLGGLHTICNGFSRVFAASAH
jgi:hypothetical protein